MSTSINDFLGYTPLTKLVETVQTGIPNPLGEAVPALFSIKEQVLGDTFARVTFAGTRKVARVGPYMAPAKQSAKQPFGTQSLKMMSPRESLPFFDEFLKIYRQTDKYDPQDNRFMEILKRQSVQQKTIFENLRIASVHSTMALGKVYLDTDGYMLPTSSGADITIDNNVPSANIGNVGSFFSNSWATASTDIVTSVLNLKTLARQTSGYKLENAFYGKNIAAYLTQNTAIQYYLARNTMLNDKWINSGVVPDGVLDLKWTPVQDSFFANASNTVQEIFPADQVTFAPAITPAVWTIYEGSTRVPTQFGTMYNSIEQALTTGSKEHYGMGSYAWGTMHPVLGIYQEMFDCFLPNMTVPGAYFLVDTTP